ncbi:MAG: hypothetical protein FJZ57_02390 [Chlamydiae bacterium]|nr:hypothetical protein [Chlamydiota bacterium]
MGSYLSKYLRLKFSASSLAMIGLSGYMLSSCMPDVTTPSVTIPTNFGVVALSTDDGTTHKSTLQLIRENKDLKDIETQNSTELHAVCMNSDGSLGVVGADLSSPTRLLFQFKASAEDTANRIVYDGIAQGLSIAYLKDTFLVGGGADDRNLYAKVLDSSGFLKFFVDLDVASTPNGAIQGVAASGEQCIAVGHYMDGVLAAPYTAVLTISKNSVGTFSQTNFHKLTFPTVTQGEIT